jgi:subtilisin family serine protease
MNRPRTRRGLAAAGLVASALVGALLGSPANATPATGEIRNAGGVTAVPDSYIVVLDDAAVGGRPSTRQAAVARMADTLADRYGATIRHVYGDVLNGFAARMPEAAARRLAAHPAVAYVEQDHTVTATATQPNAPWHLDRIDQRTPPLDGNYNYTSTGRGIPVYVIDTGIRITHVEFEGRASYGYDAVDGTLPADDCNGHGTHVAGLVAGRTYGVAKQARPIAVRVLGCTGGGTISQVIAGIDWVTAQHQPGQPAVANMSLGGGYNATLNNAVIASINDGVTYVVAAGSSAADACNYSPASVPTAIRVGASQQNDTRAPFSNYGPCVDIYAPGVNITSAWHTSDTATAMLSGTSMAAPQVAGAAARVLSVNPTWTPAQVKSYLISNATSINGLRLLYVPPTL